MMPKIFLGSFTALLLVSCGPAPVQENAASDRTATSCEAVDVSGKLLEVESEKDAFARGKKALIARAEVEKGGADCVGSGDIKVLARLVGDDNDEVRGSAALMIVAIGPKARSTVPALRASLRREVCGTSGAHPAGLLAYALERFGEIKPGEQLCETAKPVRR